MADEQTRPSPQQIAVMMAGADPWTVLGTAIDDATARNLTRDEALAVVEHVKYVLEACGLTVVNLAAAVAAEREACAGAVDEMCDDVDDPFMYGTLRAVAAAIRSRGEHR